MIISSILCLQVKSGVGENKYHVGWLSILCPCHNKNPESHLWPDQSKYKNYLKKSLFTKVIKSHYECKFIEWYVCIWNTVKAKRKTMTWKCPVNIQNVLHQCPQGDLFLKKSLFCENWLVKLFLSYKDYLHLSRLHFLALARKTSNWIC